MPILNPTTISKIESFLKLLPVYTFIAILFCYTVISFYYSYFDIEIIHYMDGSEILFSFLPFFKMSILPIGFVFVGFYIIDKFFRSKNKLINWLVISFMATVVFILPFFVYPVAQGKTFGLFVSLFGLVLYILLLLSKINNNKLPEKEKLESKRLLYIFLIGITAINFAGTYTNRMKDLTNRKYEHIVTFEHIGTKVSTGRDTMIIGQTRNYLFLLDRIKGKTLIYKMSDINNLTIIDY